MSEYSQNTGADVDLGAVRDALRAELVALGHDVASDTMSHGRHLYIIGPNDLAKALFVLGTDAGDMAEGMYRSSGSWVAGMPPRFAVLPAAEVENPAFEMLEQIRAIPLLFTIEDAAVRLQELEQLLAEHLDD